MINRGLKKAPETTTDVSKTHFFQDTTFHKHYKITICVQNPTNFSFFWQLFQNMSRTTHLSIANPIYLENEQK